MEMIEKEKVLALICKHRLYPADNAEECYLNDVLTEIITRIEQMQPVTAHWIDKTNWTGMLGYKQCQCSNCESVKSGKGSLYCERCGAKMTAYVE